MAHQPIEELELFKLFEEVAEWTWVQVKSWTHFDRETVGEQLVTAVDSVNANLVEGDGRFSGPDAIRFFVIARASAREARLWLRRAKNRGLVSELEAGQAIKKLTEATHWLNQLIAYRRRTSKRVKEEAASYSAPEWSLSLFTSGASVDPFIIE